MPKSTVIDTFWHRYQRVAILAAFGTKWLLGLLVLIKGWSILALST